MSNTYEFRVDENGFLVAGAILEQPTLLIEELIVPEWGNGKIRLKHLSAKERDDFESSMVKMTRGGRQQLNNENFRARLVQLAAVKEDGSPMFTKHDIKTLGNLPASGLQRVFNKINEMSAFSDEDLKELEGDFDEEPTEGSSTD